MPGSTLTLPPLRLAVATYQTDYLLVQAHHLPDALGALRAEGHQV